MISDLRHALRQLRNSKGLTAATLVTLAVCIGITTAIFSLVYALMVKPLPFQDPARIVEIYDSAVKGGLDKIQSDVAEYLDYSKNAVSYETLGLWKLREGMLGEDGALQRIHGAYATDEMFQLLHVRPVIGHFFTSENCRQGDDKVVVLTQSFWQTHYAEDPSVLDKTMRLDGETLRIIGVAPRLIEAFDARARFVRPLTWPVKTEDPNWRYASGAQLFGRLKSGVTVGQAAAEAATFARRYYDGAPPSVREFIERSGITETVGNVQAERVQPVRANLYLLQAGVVLVLLIGCVNVANLLLVRANARRTELAIRTALGANRSTIARQLLAESMTLSVLGAMLGLCLAWGSLRVINRYTAEMLPHALPMTLDGSVLLFTVALTLTVGVLIGLIPVVQLCRSNLTESIHQGSRGASAGRGVRTLSSVLVVGQMAFALVLMTGAGLLIHGFLNAIDVDPGFDPGNVVTARLALPSAYRNSDESAKSIRARLLAALREIPDVSSAALSYSTPFNSGVGINALTLAQDTLPPGSPQPGAYRVTVTPDYRATLRLRLVEGRFFEPADATPGRQYFVVDESFARRFFPGRSAIGGRFTFSIGPDSAADWPTIIGVVRDVPHNGVEDHSGNPFVYQLPAGKPDGLTVFLRTKRPVGDVVDAVREKIRTIDPTIPIFDAGTLQSAIDASFDNRRAVMLLLAAFAGLALFLSALGIYGVLAYDVSQRTREIGIRGAIGATRGQVVSMILKQGLWRAGIGLAIGLAGALLLSRYMTSLLFEVKPTDPISYVLVSLLLLGVAALASYLPARRAAKIDPLAALRAE